MGRAEGRRGVLHGGQRCGVGEQVGGGRCQFRCVRHLPRRAGLRRVPGGLGEVEGVGADQHRAAAGCRLDQVLPAQGHQAAADEGQVGAGVVGRHLPQRIPQPDVGGGIDRGCRFPRRGRAAGQRQAGTLGQGRYLVEALRVARHQYEQGPLQPGLAAQGGKGVQHQGLFPFPGAGGEQHRARTAGLEGDAPGPAPVAQGGGRGYVELDVAAHGDVAGAAIGQPFGVGPGLGGHGGQGGKGRADQGGKAPVAPGRAFRQSGVGQHHRHLAGSAALHQIGPQLGFHQHPDLGAPGVDEAVNRAGQVVGQVGDGDALAAGEAGGQVEGFGGVPAGGGHAGDDQVVVRIAVEQSPHHRLGGPGFTHRHGVQP